MEVYGQANKIYFPKVGDYVNNHLFTEIINNPTSKASIKDYKGQWLVLDFWSRFCSGCIASFPRMNLLTKQFSGKAKIIMVAASGNPNDPKDVIRTKALYYNQAKLNNLDLTVAFDTTVNRIFDITAFPLILVIDPVGKIAVKTYHLDSIALAKIISGMVPEELEKGYSSHEKHADSNYVRVLPLLTSGLQANGGYDTAFISRSLLTRWNDKMPNYYYTGYFRNPRAEPSNLSECMGFDLQHLFLFVNTGRIEWYYGDGFYDGIVLKTNRFSPDDLIANGIKNLYAYSLYTLVRESSLEKTKMALGEELERSFGLTSTVETKVCKVLSLVVKNRQRIKSLKNKTGHSSWAKVDDSIHVANITVKDFISRHLQLTTNIAQIDEGSPRTPILDDTNVDFKLDLSFDFQHLNLSQIKSALNQLGFDLVDTEKQMKVIVVSDSN
ncbi:Thiol-disulfide oxidoreductase ResA [Chitinophaga sp. MM2321]